MKYKISRKRAEYLNRTFFEFGFKDEDSCQKELNNISEPIELNFIAKQHNYDDGNELLHQIINNPYCDISTAKMVFFRADVDGFLKLGQSSDDYELIRSILSNFENQFYKDEHFYYDVANDPDALTFDMDELRAKVNMNISLFSKPKGRITEPSFSDNYHQRNLKFYVGNLTIFDHNDYLSVVNDKYKVEFEIPLNSSRIDEHTYEDFMNFWRFPASLNKTFGVTEKSLKSVISKPVIITRDMSCTLVLNLFCSRPLMLENSLTNVATILTNEIVYLQAFVDIIGVEDDFIKFKRVKHDGIWFAATKIMQIKVPNIDKYYFLKLILMEVDGLLFSIALIANSIDDMNEIPTTDLIGRFTITKLL